MDSARPRLEILITLLVLAWLVWQGRALSEPGLLGGWDGRYQKDLALRVDVPPALAQSRWLKTACAALAAHLPAEARGACAQDGPPARPLTPEAHGEIRQTLQSLEAARAGWAKAFYAPLADIQRQREDWEAKAREGLGVDEDWREQFDNLLKETQTYRETYRLAVRRDAAHSKPLDCAFAFLSRRAEGEGGVLALLGLAAVLDGKGGALPAGAFPTRQGWSAGESQSGCQGTPLAAAQAAADIVATAKSSAANAAKAEAMLALLPAAPWQLAAWALAGLLVLQLGRRPVVANRALFAALLVWSLAAALTRPHWQWLGGGAEIRWLAGAWTPAALLFGAALLALRLPWRETLPPALPASALGYPGFVLFAGLGWWLLLDLSATGYFDNRFMGLYQQGNLFAAFVLASLLPLLRVRLARLGLAVLGFWPLVAAGRPRRAIVAWSLALLATLALLAACKILLASHRQLTSEIFRLALLLGLPWFLLARAEALASPWASWAVRVKLSAPLLLLLLFVLGGLKLTDDNGPLLVVLYSGSLFAGLGVAWLAGRRWHWRLGMALGLLAVPAYVWAASFALLRFGGRFGQRVSERLESAQTPFTASNDQMAHVLWFQEAAAEAGGFGLGHAPWCGDLAGVCRGVPAQIQSDYVYTALAGVFGPGGAWLLVALFALWLWRLARFHLAGSSGRVEAEDLGQAWLGWMALCWAGLNLTQLAVTVAGNRAWLPLTGITFPFVSYGAWSLLVNALFLGLALNVGRKQP